MRRDSQQPPKDAVTRLGARVRELRRGRGLTLKALGRLAGLSHPFLSQVERGLARPSVDSLERIAQALAVPVSALWAHPPLDDATVVRRDEGVVVAHPQAGAPGAVRALLAGRSALRVWEWSGGAKTWPEKGETTTGQVLLYVAHGVLEVDLDGTVHALREGDALLFEGSVPHRLRRRSGPATRALFVAAA